MSTINLKKISTIFTLGLLGFGTTAVHAATCNGRTVTTHINDISQLNNSGIRTYEIVGTQGDDTILIDLYGMNGAGQNSNTVKVILRGSGVVGGKDYVCVNSDVDHLYVQGGNYVKSRGVTGYVDVEDLRDNAYVDSNSDSFITLGNGNNTVIINADGLRTRVVGGKGNDNITVTFSGDVRVDSKAGNDTINIKLTKDYSTASVHAGDGDDLVSIDTGTNKGRSFVIGGKGKDLIETGNGSDLVYGSDVHFSDTYFSWQVSSTRFITSIDNFNGAAYAFDISGSFSVDSPLYTYLTSLYDQDTSGGEISANSGDDHIYGTDGKDYLRGGAGNDHIYAEGDRDRLWGGSGDDALYADGGDDDVYGESGNDRMYGGDGNDVMKGGTGNDSVNGNSGDDLVAGNENDDTVSGGSGRDECRGSPGNDTITGCEL